MIAALKFVALVALAALVAAGVMLFLHHVKLGRQRRTMGDMRTIATALESYRIDGPAYPILSAHSDAELDAFASLLSPTYVRELPRRDRWGNSFQIVSTAQEYTITSLARDRKPDSEVRHGVEASGATSDAGADMVFATGGFVQFPGPVCGI